MQPTWHTELMNPQNDIFSGVIKTSLSFLICLIIFFVVLFAYIKLAGPFPFTVNSTTTQKTDAFNVTGTGKASVSADQATLRLGVTAQAPTAESVREEMNQSINKVTAGIKALGVPDTDIKTENFNINPNYDYTPDGKQNIIGYNGNVNLVVKVKQTELANKVIDTATANGANQVGGVSFDTVDQTAAEEEARTKAIADAKMKAEKAAQAAGFKLGKIINYNEGFGGNPVPMYDARMLNAAGGVAEKTPTQLEEGQNEITVSVTLSYEII